MRWKRCGRSSSPTCPDEIESPLTSIRGFASALQQDHLTAEERRHYLDIIEAESVRLSRLSANLLKSLTSLESDHVRFEPKGYRLDTQIRGLILACEPQWAEKDLEMDVTLEEADITADEDLLSQVWINLLHNSIKFTPRGGSVRVALYRRGDRLENEYGGYRRGDCGGRPAARFRAVLQRRTERGAVRKAAAAWVFRSRRR